MPQNCGTPDQVLFVNPIPAVKNQIQAFRGHIAYLPSSSRVSMMNFAYAPPLTSLRRYAAKLVIEAWLQDLTNGQMNTNYLTSTLKYGKEVEYMNIIESWEDHNNRIYAVVKHSEKDQKDFGIKACEAMWLDEGAADKADLFSFAGSVGYRIAGFDTLEEAEDFLLKGISIEDTNPDIWFEMLAV